jgi:hypothetical protein
VEVKLHLFLSAAIDGVMWTVSRPGGMNTSTRDKMLFVLKDIPLCPLLMGGVYGCDIQDVSKIIRKTSREITSHQIEE